MMTTRTYKLIHEWVVDHPDDWDTFDCQADGGADHWVSVDLSVSASQEEKGRGIYEIGSSIDRAGTC